MTMRKIALVLALLTVCHAAFAQQNAVSDTLDLSNLSLAELTKMKSRYAATEMEQAINQAIEAASRKPLSLRKSPSIISVITADEIEKSGASDLMGVFRMIPGLEFNIDVEGVVALSFRGLWVNEGNISLQIDGQEINEIAYASLQFGNHHNVSDIKKVEIIRGPGSAIYGGCAEYAVINIITKRGEDIRGVTADVALGQTAKTYTHQNVSLAIGNKKKDFAYSVSGMIGRGKRSDQLYTDAYNNSYDMTSGSALNPATVNASVSYKGLSLQFFYDDYRTTTRDASIQILSKPYPLDFLTCMTGLKYEKQLNNKLRLNISLSHKYANPWTFRGQPDPVDSLYNSYLLNANRYKGAVNVLWDPLYWLNVNVGMESYADYGHLTGGMVFRKDSTSDVGYMNYAPYAQLLFKSRLANVTVGARYDISSAFGSAFNPRLGITKRVGLFNFKLLYASSFRAPALESIQFALDNTQLKPEQSHTVEFETSVKITKHMYLSVNCFDITTQNAIRYFVKTDSVFTGFQDGYTNSKVTTGSQGVELEYKYKSAFGFVNLSYAYYTVQNKNVDPANEVPVFRAMTLGTAKHKVTLTGSINIGKHIYVSPSVNLLGRRYGYASADSAGNGIIQYYKPQTTVNLFVGSSSLIKNCSLGIGVNNLLNENILYLQAYNSLHAPLPGMSRAYVLRFGYHLPFKSGS